MDVAEEKKELIHWIEDLDNPDMLQAIQSLKNSTEPISWNDLPEAAKESIQIGKNDVKNGRVVSHEEVRKSYKKWL